MALSKARLKRIEKAVKKPTAPTADAKLDCCRFSSLMRRVRVW